MKINVGCGWECREGWLNVDNTEKPQAKNYPILKMDATGQWPYEDETFEYVLSEHMIEHLPEAKGLSFLKEALRCMKTNAVARITCPDREFAEDLIKLGDFHPFVVNYCRDIFKRQSTLGDAAQISKRMLYGQGHVWVPTAEMLINQMQKAGFKNVKQVTYGESEHDVFNGLEQSNGVREWETLCVEGTK